MVTLTKKSLKDFWMIQSWTKISYKAKVRKKWMLSMKINSSILIRITMAVLPKTRCMTLFSSFLECNVISLVFKNLSNTYSWRRAKKMMHHWRKHKNRGKIKISCTQPKNRLSYTPFWSKMQTNNIKNTSKTVMIK